ncbi:hypothetical protein J1N35_022006 [Gossypium stocksii]|uniref:Uncharacterized protein n=1 Tax=Gossypium stocksii TaxID=47602 RepID=A0A9D3VFM4_9ROSI|nr:hypothetical protein J1N35_022006 [Gossypium stocksii]
MSGVMEIEIPSNLFVLVMAKISGSIVFTDGIDELRNSLCFSQSLTPAEHWMVMPMTGVLIANRFGVILNYLTK